MAATDQDDSSIARAAIGALVQAIGKNVLVPTATDNVPLVRAALTQPSDVKGIFAPSDELAKGTVQAVQNNNLAGKVKVVGAEIPTADIQVITAKISPWVATAGAGPSAVGAAVVRTAALELAGQLGRKTVEFPAVAITRDRRPPRRSSNLDQFCEALPALNPTPYCAATSTNSSPPTSGC